MMPARWPRQFARFATVGLVSNAVLYAAYLVLTAAGMGAKLAMTLLYAVGVCQTFVFNKRWTFSFRGPGAPAFSRYAVSYALGYLVQLAILHVFVDRLGFPHQAVQAAAMVQVAVLLFLLHRFWVFPAAAAHPPPEQPT
ncbi:GtrA family protein [Ramlibacter sp. HM2]|uniref:GtrA family protein n=1 Tax=Ramlibacter pallidus TaxID=2780087 RepID=A0ABR9S9H1_9BURK|nr:GtrA family protein [Ramlibacter pallidus]